MAFNLFTVSSDNSYRENFHSDIMAALLDPHGLYGQGNLYLRLFLDYLVGHHRVEVSKEDFQQTVVSRETGRLDIWIRDESSTQSTIIENKINDAPDMVAQLDRYFDYANNRRNYAVKAVVYLSLDGMKKAPATKENFGHLVKNIGAFTNREKDLLRRWLQPRWEAAPDSDNQSFILQYIKLIKHLANHSMDNKMMEEFYQFLSQTNGFGTLNSIYELNNRLPAYRAEEFMNQIGDYEPFKKACHYRPHYWLLDDYREGGTRFKLDVWFIGDGSAALVFWDGENHDGATRWVVTAKLQAIEMLNEFENEVSFGKNGYPKRFAIGESYATMEVVDKAVLKFVQELCRRLKATVK